MTQFFSFMKQTARSFGERANLLWYTRPQSYHGVYQVSLRNISSHVASFQLIFPLPAQYSFQEVYDISLLPRSAHIGIDRVYKNHYAYWESSLPPKEFATFQLNLTIKKYPQRISIPSGFSTQHYEDRKSEVSFGPNRFVNPEHPRIQDIVQKLPQHTSLAQQLREIERYVLNHFIYGSPITGLYTLDEAFTQKTIDCGGMNVIFISICLALGIPARLVSGFWAGDSVSSFDKTMHAWVEIVLPDGSIVSADPAVAWLRKHSRTWKLGHIGCVGSDRIVFSFGCGIPLGLNRETIRVPILQHPTLITKSRTSLVMETRWYTQRFQRRPYAL